MNLGLDLDGTISNNPVMFAALGAAMVQAGHQVVVITGALANFPESMRTYPGRTEQLTALGLEKDTHYTDLYICLGSSGHDVANQKREYCAAMNIDFLIDNEPLYITEVKKVTSAALYYSKE